MPAPSARPAPPPSATAAPPGTGRRAFAALALLGRFLRPHRGRVAGATAAMLAAAALLLLLGQGLRHLIDAGFVAGDPGRLDAAVGLLLLAVAALAVATASRFFLVSSLGERVAADLRGALFAKVLSLSPAFFETARTGDVLSRLTADTGVLQALSTSVISQWLRSALTLLGALAMLVVTSPELAGLVLLVVPLVLLPMILFSRRERALSRVAQDRVADLGAYAEETLNALRTVQAFTHEAQDRARFGAAVDGSVAASLARMRVRAGLLFCVILLGFGAIGFGLWAGGRAVLAGEISAGEMSAFVFYAVITANAASGLSELWGEVQRAAGAAERIAELLAEVPAIAAPAQPRPFPEPPQGRVEFRDVHFRYPARPDRAALHGFSLTVEPGKTVALVGPSGAGKSTVLQLLLRFYDPQSGSIRVDGVELREADPAALRRRLGLVPQDPVVFGADAWSNIRYGRPDAPDAAVRDAARAAAAGFLDDLPRGFGTFLGEKGVRLSGGQRQRVAIARAILRDAPILLLDEATSALDSESEQAVQEALATASRGRTTLVIAHRLATVRRADRIVVMEEGRIVATGRHEDLIRQGGLYARLAELQFTDATR
ncbi:ABC transporter transmembrane domain-containing protein [Roseomonas sp. BN140053]|uniref:ABC transporter transmembrane domain-containing protein n=1 Tax=Roseomonas sp. BN140053 TaxID=3391898 RepID=UPI0039EBA362